MDVVVSGVPQGNVLSPPQLIPYIIATLLIAEKNTDGTVSDSTIFGIVETDTESLTEIA